MGASAPPSGEAAGSPARGRGSPYPGQRGPFWQGGQGRAQAPRSPRDEGAKEKGGGGGGAVAGHGDPLEELGAIPAAWHSAHEPAGRSAASPPQQTPGPAPQPIAAASSLPPSPPPGRSPTVPPSLMMIFLASRMLRLAALFFFFPAWVILTSFSEAAGGGGKRAAGGGGGPARPFPAATGVSLPARSNSSSQAPAGAAILAEGRENNNPPATAAAREAHITRSPDWPSRRAREPAAPPALGEDSQPIGSGGPRSLARSPPLPFSSSLRRGK